jgi:alpha-L-rhamnosidase
VRVRTAAAGAGFSAWSEPLAITCGTLGGAGWTAPYIQAKSSVAAQPTLLRGVFEAPSDFVRAVLYATARGVYQAELNGVEVDDLVFKPGWTSYQQRLLYEVSDVTRLLRPGTNVWGVWLAGGWYTEEYGFRGDAHRVYGSQPSFSGFLVLQRSSGREVTVRVDERWSGLPGPIISSGIYAGEAYDARGFPAGWGEAGFDERAWAPVELCDDPPQFNPRARSGPAVRRTQWIPAQAISFRSPRSVVVDFGQNVVGRVRIRVRGPRGHRVTIRHAEVLENGLPAYRPLRYATATDSYVLSGEGEESWEPRFTFHGFRFVEIFDWPTEFNLHDVGAVVIHSDMVATGQFECSDLRVNRLVENARWSMRGNFLSIPSDCPQRDERLGWTGDIQVFAPTATFFYDCAGFLASWLEDLTIAQSAAGGVPFVVPNVLEDAAAPMAGWGDAATVVPSVLRERLGDRAVLERQYSSMKDWSNQQDAQLSETGVWRTPGQFGDWLDPMAPPEDPFSAKASPDVTATAYVFRSAMLTATAAAQLGDGDSAQYFAQRARAVQRAWRSEFVKGDRIESDAPAVYALAIAFELAPDLSEAWGLRLASLVRENGFRISTGFLGTPVIQDALSSTGHHTEAGLLLLQEECPSWLYPVSMGATTIWERWDSLLPDGTVNPGEMTSFNHYALGSVVDWLVRVVAGLAPGEDAYRVVQIRPRPIDGLSRATARFDGPYGPIRVEWNRQGKTIVVTAEVPPNSSATVLLPGGSEVFEIGSGSHRWVVQS